MNRIIVFCCFIFLTGSVCAQKIQYNSLSIPDALRKNASEVVRSEKMEFIVKNISEAKEMETVVVTILNAESQANELVFDYDQYSEIKKLWTKIYDANGNEVNAYKEKDFSDRSAIGSSNIYSDSRWLFPQGLIFTVK